MKRLALFLVLALVLAQPAMADALLRPNVVVDSDVVRLGDLFDNVGDKADTVVARAPAPGKRVTCDAEWLQHIAAMNQVVWRPQTLFDQAVVERTGVTVTHDRIEAELRTALSTQGVPDQSEIDLDNRNTQVTVPINVSTQVGVRDLFYDSHTKRFTATVEVPADAPNATRLRVTGRVYTTVDVPVLARSLARDEVITAHDITWKRIREDTLRRDVITDADQLIGMTPRQTVRNGQLVSTADLQKPLAVKRGAMVTMVLQLGSMTLTAQGRADEQGSVGDVIRLTNMQSNMTVQGRVDGPNQVSVAPNGGVALAN
jgi:flagella basal body P-ring formation protein FlgA